MQILKSLLKSLFILGVLGVLAVFVAREALLWLALNQVAADFQKLEQRVTAGEFAPECTRLGNFNTAGVAQVRFLDQRTYALEVSCDQTQTYPVMVSKQTLPLLAIKAYGDSGLVSGASQHALELQVLGRSGLLQQAEPGKVSLEYGKLPADQPLNGPATMCAGYGLTCCQENEEQGHGRAIQGAIDCPKSCYEGCWARPVVLGFNTQPFYDVTTRVVDIPAGQEVTFDYTISETQQDSFADTPLKEQKNGLSVVLAVVQSWFQPQAAQQTGLQQVTVVFGDGEQVQLTEPQGSVTHSYACQKAECSYEATVTAVNAQGVTAQTTRLGTVTIKVTR